MDLRRYKELYEKQSSGAISDAENLEFEGMRDQRLAAIFETCPACAGAFSSLQIRQTNKRCPNCDTQLKFFTGASVGHDFHEIDKTIKPRGMMGEFWAGWAVLGTIRCALCATVYPHKYTCCPRLLVYALLLIETGSSKNRSAAIKFIDDHSSVLVNSLRGGFASKFDEGHREILAQIAPELGCCGELEAILKNVE